MQTMLEECLIILVDATHQDLIIKLYLMQLESNLILQYQHQ
nr:MAG TPA: hypothetical protein [Caudoviricetes sp.]